ncbi:MAG: prepilin-type N-terminal cleavage/methylation domain-containing protein, partial [Nitrospirae bacterium]|nr:prepilin-type N-terminal cleavage/methylation domain-containing protein [Nitrospirota bacterium]
MKKDEKGFTLLEVLVSMGITLVVTAAGYTFFNNTFNFSILHSRTAEMQRETRVAIDIMSREIRNAGFGIVEPLTGIIQGTVSPIQASNNVDPTPSGTANKLDRITLVEGYETIGTLNAAATLGATTLTMVPSTGVNPTSPSIVGSTITLEGFYTGVVTAVAGGPAVYTLTLSTGLNRAYTTSNSVMIVRTITYRVAVPAGSTEPVLYRNAN